MFPHTVQVWGNFNYMPIIYKRNCNFCGKYYEGNGKLYCSPKCHYLYGNPKTGIWKNCLFCNKEFYVIKSMINNNKFCCHNCYGKWLVGRPNNSHTKFKKGIIPWSKSQKGIHLSPETEFKKGSLNSRWHPEGYEYSRNNSEYLFIKCSNHNRANKNGYVSRSVLVAEFCLKRNLNKEEIIHHLDFNRRNDKPINLYLFPNGESHSIYHLKLYHKLVPKITKSNLPTIDESILPENLQC